MDINAMGAMLVLEEGGEGRAGNARQHPVERLDQRHLLAELAQHCRRFQPDISAADDGIVRRGR